MSDTATVSERENPLPFSQAELTNAIAKFIDYRGVKAVNQRQFNAIVTAADEIMEELRKPHVFPAIACGLEAWYASDETGLSSLFMARRLASAAGFMGKYWMFSGGVKNHHPHDPSDFGRCVGLLKAVPELRPYISTLASDCGRVWAGLIAAWSELETLYEEEHPTGRAPKLYARMQEVIAIGRQEESAS